MSLYPEIQFYDYTKWDPSMRKPKDNYHLTYSRKEDDQESTVQRILDDGYNVAVVFDKLPERFLGHPVLDGDKTDLRFLDGAGVIGLVAKGEAKKDTSGFVIHKVKL